LHEKVKNVSGTKSSDFTGVCTNICNVCNLLAVNLIKDEKFGEALDLLKKSELLSESNERGLAMTYNNFACYYRKIGHLRTSLIYLEQALELESNLESSSEKAETHLNTCAVLSQLERHDLAM